MLRISNPTLQDWTVPYRIGEPGRPEFGIMRQFSVRRGEQIELLLPPIETQQVIAHLRTHGARDAAEMNGSMRGFSGLLYSDVRPISEDEILEAHQVETQTREDRSVQEAVKGALGFDKAARKPNNQRPGARMTEVEVTQEVPRGQRRKGDEVAFTMAVTPDGTDSPDVRRVLTA